MLSYSEPLHLLALERSELLKPWVESWWPDESLEWLSHEDWFTTLHPGGNFVWSPPPAAADAALEQLCRVHLKRPLNTCHLLVLPRLMTSWWRKKVLKACTCCFYCIPACFDIWDNSQHEPLMIAICLPLSKHRTWNLRATQHVGELEGIWARCNNAIPMGHGIFCANFSSTRGRWSQCRGAWCAKCYVPATLDKFPVKMLVEEVGTVVIRGRLPSDKDKFLTARNGNHMLCPFQCDSCHFRNLKDRDPLRDDCTDQNLLTAIRRSNLDSFWGRAPFTALNNLRSACIEGHLNDARGSWCDKCSSMFSTSRTSSARKEHLRLV
jgi:hypothetical protein